MANLLVSVICPDRTGLVASIAGCLFDLGVNLGDASFSLLGKGSEFTAICRIPAHLTVDALEAELATLPELAAATIRITPFSMETDQGPDGRVSHLVTVAGGDRPGLVARLAEAFAQFDANIVRMDAQTESDGKSGRYVTRYAVAIPAAATTVCLNTVANIAGELGLSCDAIVVAT